MADNETRKIICYKPSEVVPTEFDQLRPRRWNDFHKFATVPETPNVTPNANRPETVQSDQSDLASVMSILKQQDETINSLCTVNEAARSHKFSQLNKIKVEFDDDVPHFIALVEEWASSNQIYDDSQIIRKASAAITQSSKGMSIREALAISPSNTWADFKSKLQELLGQDKSYYRKTFRTLQKQTFETFGEYLAKLTMNYKYAYALQAISKHDRLQIKTQFIDNLEQPLKGFLEAEDLKDDISFTNLAARAEQLFRAHGMGENSKSICHVKKEQKSNSVISDILAETQKQNKLFFDELMNSQRTMMREFIREMRESKSETINALRHENSAYSRPRENEGTNQRKPFRPTEDDRKRMKQQICRRFNSENGCKYSESQCFYKHEKN